MLSKQSVPLLKNIVQSAKLTGHRCLSTLPGIFQKDVGNAPFVGAHISLPDTYSGQIQSAQGREHEFSKNRGRDTIDYNEANNVDSAMSLHNQETDPTVAQDSHTEYHDDSCNVSLHSVMQSNVPEPYSRSPTHMNMPGAGIMQRQRFEGSRRIDIQSAVNSAKKRDFHTFTRVYSQGGFVAEQDFEPPAPQGVQGDDCVTFKLFMENCQRYNLDCDKDLQGIQSGRKTLSQVFAEQDELIRKITAKYEASKGLPESGQSSASAQPEVGKSSSLGSPNDPPPDDSKLSQKERFKRAIKEYGATVVVFHVGISLVSLGGFYALVSSGIDVVGLIQKTGIAEEFLKSKLAAGASTFVVAYAVHKVFAPVRIGITLTCTPLIVRHLRKIGFLKPPKPKD